MEAWGIPEYNSYDPPDPGLLRDQNGTYLLSSEPISLRSLVLLTGVLLWWIYLLVVVLTSGLPGPTWRPAALVGLGCFLALRALSLKRKTRRGLLAGPQLQLPQALLDAGRPSAVRFQHVLTDTESGPPAGRLLARLLCLNIISTSDDPNDLQQHLLFRSDLPPHDIEPGMRGLDHLWVLDLPPDAPASCVPGWPRLLWVLQVRLELHGQPARDIRFLLPVAGAEEGNGQAAPSARGPGGGNAGRAEQDRTVSAPGAAPAHPAHLPAPPLFLEVLR